MKTRNPIARAVKKIRPKVLPMKPKDFPKDQLRQMLLDAETLASYPMGSMSDSECEKLHEYAERQLDRNSKKK